MHIEDWTTLSKDVVDNLHPGSVVIADSVQGGFNIVPPRSPMYSTALMVAVAHLCAEGFVSQDDLLQTSDNTSVSPLRSV